MGIFIVIEGPNGAGKSTTITLLKDALEKQGYSVNLTKEPSELETGKMVRNSEGKYTSKVYTFLIAADRCNHVEQILLPSIENYDITICDRYVQSSLVLQQADGVKEELIWNLNSDFIKPDLSFVLMASEENLQSRLSSRENLTYYENKLSRNDEVCLYRKTTTFLKEKGYNISILKNNNSTDLEYNIDMMVSSIRKIKT